MEIGSTNNTEDNKHEAFVLKRRIGLWSGVSIAIGSMVGSGIFVSPTEVLKGVNGSVGLSLIIWLMCGLISMCSSLCYCEIGASLKASGMDFLNFKLVYGSVVSFVYIWRLRAGGAATSLIFARYLTAPFFGDCNPPNNIIKLVAFMLLFVLFYINYTSVTISVKFEVIFFVAKFLAMALIAIVGIIHLAKGNPSGIANFEKSFQHEALSNLSISDISMAIYQGMFAYQGFNALNSVSEEIKNPAKDLPRASVLSLVSVIVIYLLVNIGYFSVLPASVMVSSKAVGTLFGNKTLGSMAWLIPLFVCISTAGNVNGLVLQNARVVFVAGRSGLAPEVFGMIHTRYFSPSAGLVLNFCITLIFILIGNFNTIVSAFSFYIWMWHGLSAASVFLLRRKYPDLDRPYKVPIFCPIITIIASVYFIITPFIQSPNPIILLAIGYEVVVLIFYYLIIVRQYKFPGMKQINLFLQKLMEIAVTDWRECEGLNPRQN